MVFRLFFIGLGILTGPAVATSGACFFLLSNPWRAAFEAGARAETVLREGLRKDSSLQSWIALHDFFVAEAEQQLSLVPSRLEKSFVTTRSWAVRSSALSHSLVIRRAVMQGIARFLLPNPTRLDIRLPAKIPEEDAELVPWVGRQLVLLQRAFSQAELGVSRRLPTIEALERRAYAFAYGFEEKLGQKVEHGLRPPSQIGVIREAVFYAWRFFLPVGQAVYWAPQAEVFERYQHLREAGVSDAQAYLRVRESSLAPYPARVRIQRIAEPYQVFMQLMASSAMLSAVGSSGMWVYRGDWKPHVGIAETVSEIVSDPEEMAQAMDEYSKDPNGSSLVKDFYEKQIADLEEAKSNHGDPDGAIQRAIDDCRKQIKEVAW